MRITVNKPRRDDFVNAFMNSYSSPGVGIKHKETVYNTTFEMVELKNSYKATIKGVTKRFSSLCFLAEFIYDQTFDIRYVHWPTPTPYQQQRMQATKDRVEELKRVYC